MAMDEALAEIVSGILEVLPASIEMPAGTGKTHIVAGVAATAAIQGRSTLVLTHTHAGVDAIRRRLRSFGVPKEYVQVETISSWVIGLLRSYPLLGGIEVPSVPDWGRSREYIQGAVSVGLSEAIKRVHGASFDFLLVDEYQDCTKEQHKFICAIHEAIPATLLIGDRLQGIFGFSGPLVDWDTDILPTFPQYEVPMKSWRWTNHNSALGEWLLELRSALSIGGSIDLSDVNVDGVRWMQTDLAEVRKASDSFRSSNESVVIIGKMEHDILPIAMRLGGRYTVMEDIQGTFMIEFLNKLVTVVPQQYAICLAEFAKKCFVGLKGIDGTVKKRLITGAATANLTREGIAEVLVALDGVVRNPTFNVVGEAMKTIDACAALRLYRCEAWRDVRRAIAAVVADETVVPTEALARVRDRVRHAGRSSQNRVVSRTVLIKGLEYDHAIVMNAESFDHRNLYVALTRARKTVTVFSKSSVLAFK